ncbi:hypothetical protein B0H13DRAFT_1853958 [Mycena leptocephala]|nr:hypothetical protein B0H13DRAFT_1853958 [Mycena leptocephala]
MSVEIPLKLFKSLAIVCALLMGVVAVPVPTASAIAQRGEIVSTLLSPLKITLTYQPALCSRKLIDQSCRVLTFRLQGCVTLPSHHLNLSKAELDVQIQSVVAGEQAALDAKDTNDDLGSKIISQDRFGVFGVSEHALIRKQL